MWRAAIGSAASDRRQLSVPAAPSNNLTDLTIWSSDYHIGIVADIKTVLSQLGVRTIDYSLSGHCHLTATCAPSELPILPEYRSAGLARLDFRSGELARRFFNEYRGRADVQSADAFLCTYYTGLCELFLPFGKPIIVVAAIPYETQRTDEKSWRRLNQILALIATRPGSIVAGNNAYHVECARRQ